MKIYALLVATLSNKPGRAELKMLHTWDKAIRILVLKSPAFASAWEMALEEAGKRSSRNLLRREGISP